MRSIQNEWTGAAGLPDEQAYRKLVLDMKRFFESEQLAVSVVAAQRQDDEVGPAEESGGGGVPVAILAAGVLAGLALVGAAAYFLMR